MGDVVVEKALEVVEGAELGRLLGLVEHEGGFAGEAKPGGL